MFVYNSVDFKGISYYCLIKYFKIFFVNILILLNIYFVLYKVCKLFVIGIKRCCVYGLFFIMGMIVLFEFYKYFKKVEFIGLK